MFRELLAAEFGPYGKLSELQLDQLETHYRVLSRWNQKLNLTRITSEREAIQFHYCESLFLATRLPQESLRIADVGSGPGFPGAPVAVWSRSFQVSLVESDRRKVAFLLEACRHIPNVSVVRARGEDLQDKFDWVVSRAVGASRVRKMSLAPNLALLVGEEGPLEDTAVLGTVNLPWGANRKLALFHVERNAS